MVKRLRDCGLFSDPRIEIECVKLAEFKNALEGLEVVNATQGDKSAIRSVLDTELEEYDVMRVGDLLSMAGQNLAPDTENEDEYVALIRGDELVKKATGQPVMGLMTDELDEEPVEVVSDTLVKLSAGWSLPTGVSVNLEWRADPSETEYVQDDHIQEFTVEEA